MEEATEAREFGFIRPKPTQRDLIEVESQRALQEVQASMIIAKRFPRDQEAAYLRIIKACERFSLAEQAEYAYPRGGQSVTGASIRLAEVIAQNWENMQFGIRELSQAHGESEVEAFAWDVETNTRQVKTFKVPHKRYTKAKGNVDLEDPRDIYEHTANQGARRMRACILGVIPGDIVDAAIQKCRETVKKGIKAKPLIDQIRATLKAFDSLGVTKDLIEKRLGHGTDAITEEELIELNNIGKSIKDNMTSREEWFDLKAFGEKEAQDLNEKIKSTTDKPTGEDPYKVKDKPETLKPRTEKDKKFDKSILSKEEQDVYDGFINIRKPGILKSTEDIVRKEMPSWSEALREQWNLKWKDKMRKEEDYTFPGDIPEEGKEESEPKTSEVIEEGTGPAFTAICPNSGEKIDLDVDCKKCPDRANEHGDPICVTHWKHEEKQAGNKG